MSTLDVTLLWFLYVVLGVVSVWVLRKYVPHHTSDEDLDIRYVGDGLLVLIWPVLVVLAAVVGLLAGIGWLANHRPPEPSTKDDTLSDHARTDWR